MIKNPAADHQLTIDLVNGEKPLFKKGIKGCLMQCRR